MPEGYHRQFGDFHVGAFLCDGAEDCVALRADGQAVARVFDIAAGEEIALRRQQRTADLKARVGGVGFRGGGSGGFEKV